MRQTVRYAFVRCVKYTADSHVAEKQRSSGNNASRYDMQNFLNANIGVTPYTNQSNPLMDQYAIDTLLSMYNADVDKKKQSK